MALAQSQSDYRCYNCQTSCIRGDPSLIRAVGNLYHKQCFKCNSCQISVIDKFYIMDDSQTILCEKDYYQQSDFKCHQCNQAITKDDYEVIGVYKYHGHCLHCPGCTIVKNLPPSSTTTDENSEESFERFDYNGRPYCRYHYSLIKGTECVGCGQAVLCQYMDNNGKWHPECYMIMKYWHVGLIDLRPIPQSDYKSKNQLISIQNDIEYTRCTIWKELSAFEDTTSKIISSIASFHQSQDYKQLYGSCQFLSRQMNILFSVLDLVFKYFTHLSCDTPTQKMCDQLVYFLDTLCQTNNQDIEDMLKLATVLSQNTRDLVKLGLQQTIILERQNKKLIDQVLTIYTTKPATRTMDIACLSRGLQLVDLAMARLAFVSDIKPQEGKQPDETEVVFKQTTRPSLFPVSQQSRMVNSTSNINYLTKTNSDIPTSLSRSKSVSRKPNTIQYSIQQVEMSNRNTPSRMDTIRRALTTRAKKDSPSILSRSNSIFSASGRRDQKSLSVHNPATAPLYISLPDVEQLHSTPPLSPPSANQQVWIIPVHLPDLTHQQDCIIRHIATLYIESHVNDCIILDDLLNLIENKKQSTSLWGKLKTHILTPNESAQNPFNVISNTEKKIGVSLSNLSSGSLNQQQTYKLRDVPNFEDWIAHCPSVVASFSSNSLAPAFLKDCVLSMIGQGVNTEGIFRKNGNIRALKEMCEQLDESQQDDWLDFFGEQHIIQLAVFIKKYLRELPEPLLTYRLHKLFLMSNDKADDIAMIHCAICILPKANRDILLLVLGLLNWVGRHSSENKMGFENLAKVMAPNILYSHKKQSVSSVVDVSLCHGEIRVVTTMIEFYEVFSKVPNDFTVLLEHQKMAEFTCTNAVDLSCPKNFVRIFDSLLKVKKEITSSGPVLPPSPSTSTL